MKRLLIVLLLFLPDLAVAQAVWVNTDFSTATNGTHITAVAPYWMDCDTGGSSSCIAQNPATALGDLGAVCNTNPSGSGFVENMYYAPDNGTGKVQNVWQANLAGYGSAASGFNPALDTHSSSGLTVIVSMCWPTSMLQATANGYMHARNLTVTAGQTAFSYGFVNIVKKYVGVGTGYYTDVLNADWPTWSGVFSGVTKTCTADTNGAWSCTGGITITLDSSHTGSSLYGNTTSTITVTASVAPDTGTTATFTAAASPQIKTPFLTRPNTVNSCSNKGATGKTGWSQPIQGNNGGCGSAYPLTECIQTDGPSGATWNKDTGYTLSGDTWYQFKQQMNAVASTNLRRMQFWVRSWNGSAWSAWSQLVDSGWSRQYSITAISRNTNLVTVTVASTSGMSNGDYGTISGVSDASFNGNFDNVTVLSGTQFRFAQTGANGSSSGGVFDKAILGFTDDSSSCRQNVAIGAPALENVDFSSGLHFAIGSVFISNATVVTVSISPTSVSLNNLDTQTFTGTCAGGALNTCAYSTDCGVNGSINASTGLFTAGAGAVTCHATATSNDDNTVSASATITLNSAPPTINSFTASPSFYNVGNTTLLSWSTTNAASCSINQGIGSVSTTDSMTVNPKTQTIFTLTCTNAAGSTPASATVSVGGASQIGGAVSGGPVSQ